jgi:hypothetical protein
MFRQYIVREFVVSVLNLTAHLLCYVFLKAAPPGRQFLINYYKT